MKSFLRFVLPLLLGFGLVYVVFRGQDFSKIGATIRSANIFWLLLCAFLALLSNVSRAIRWKTLLEPLNHFPSTVHTTFAVMFGYLANLAFPRLGEVSRCGALKKTDNIPLDVSLGTVIAERIIDLLFLMFITLATVFLNTDTLFVPILKWLNTKYSINLSLKESIFGLIAAIGIGLLVLFWIYKGVLKKENKDTNAAPTTGKLASFMQGLGNGLKTIFRLQSPKTFWFHSFFIWLMYYLMIICIIKSIPQTSMLGFNEALLVLVIGSFGFVAPVQGGIGAYHAAVSWSLVLIAQSLPNFDISSENALAFATLSHSSQMVFVLIFGLVAVFGIFVNKSIKS